MISPTLPLNENLESIRKALAETTPEKWVYDNKSVVCEKHFGLIADCFDNENVKAEANATWIAASKDVCEYLLKVVEIWQKVACDHFDDGEMAREFTDKDRLEIMLEEVQKRLEGTRP